MTRKRGVYVIEAVGTGLIKIGVTSDLDGRLSDLRFMAAAPIRLHAFVPGAGRAEERELHLRYAAHRSHGEWFHYEPLRDTIDALGTTIELSQRLTCADCGAIRSQHSRERSKRCRPCAAKRRAEAAAAARAARAICVACGVGISVAAIQQGASSGFCRSCGMRKAWSTEAYVASIMAARAARRKRCRHCGRDGLSKRGNYHPECWALAQSNPP